MPRSDRRHRDLVELAAAVTGAAAAAQVIQPQPVAASDVLGDAIWAVLLDKLDVGSYPDRTLEYPAGDGDDLTEVKDALVEEIAPQLERHDSDCQANQHTYVHPGEPGIFLHGSAGLDRTPLCLDAVGTNGRRLLVRDDPDGVYIGGAMFTNDQVIKLAAHLDLLVDRRRYWSRPWWLSGGAGREPSEPRRHGHGRARHGSWLLDGAPAGTGSLPGVHAGVQSEQAALVHRAPRRPGAPTRSAPGRVRSPAGGRAESEGPVPDEQKPRGDR